MRFGIVFFIHNYWNRFELSFKENNYGSNDWSQAVTNPCGDDSDHLPRMRQTSRFFNGITARSHREHRGHELRLVGWWTGWHGWLWGTKSWCKPNMRTATWEDKNNKSDLNCDLLFSHLHKLFSEEILGFHLSLSLDLPLYRLTAVFGCWLSRILGLRFWETIVTFGCTIVTTVSFRVWQLLLAPIICSKIPNRKLLS